MKNAHLISGQIAGVPILQPSLLQNFDLKCWDLFCIDAKVIAVNHGCAVQVTSVSFQSHDCTNHSRRVARNRKLLNAIFTTAFDNIFGVFLVNHIVKIDKVVAGLCAALVGI